MHATYRCVPQINFQIKKTADEGIPSQNTYGGILTHHMNATIRCVPQINFPIKKTADEGFLHKNKI